MQGFKVGFNSNMVRLNVDRSTERQEQLSGFNSNMVRLNVIIDTFRSCIPLVSIPIWFD